MGYYEKKFEDWEFRVKEASLTTDTAAAAAAKLGVKHDTYRKYAIKYNCYKTNQFKYSNSKENIDKLPNSNKFKLTPLHDILEGKYPSYPRGHLKRRVLAANLLSNICSICTLGPTWNGLPLTLHLDHINGISTDNTLANLRLLCPNCHSQTPTYSGRNSKNGGSSPLMDTI